MNGKIDIGGTPAFVINAREYEVILQKFSKERVILVLDPFDLSRNERTIVVNGVRIKFEIDANDVNISADTIPAPKTYKANKEMGAELKGVLDDSCRECKTLRNFMNSLVCYFTKDLKICLLEDVLISIKDKILQIIKTKQIPVRAICPICNKFCRINLGEKTCCGASKEIIETGRYIPEKGYFRPFLLLAGIIPSIPETEMIAEFKKRCEELGVEAKYVMINNKNGEKEVK